MEILNIGFFCY